MSDFNTVVQQGSRRASDSTWQPRISAVQHEAIVRGLRSKSLDLENIGVYVTTGDLADLSAENATTLSLAVKHAKKGLTPSQAKRIWPRKVAAVALIERSSR